MELELLSFDDGGDDNDDLLSIDIDCEADDDVDSDLGQQVDALLNESSEEPNDSSSESFATPSPPPLKKRRLPPSARILAPVTDSEEEKENDVDIDEMNAADLAFAEAKKKKLAEKKKLAKKKKKITDKNQMDTSDSDEEEFGLSYRNPANEHNRNLVEPVESIDASNQGDAEPNDFVLPDEKDAEPLTNALSLQIHSDDASIWSEDENNQVWRLLTDDDSDDDMKCPLMHNGRQLKYKKKISGKYAWMTWSGIYSQGFKPLIRHKYGPQYKFPLSVDYFDLVDEDQAEIKHMVNMRYGTAKRVHKKVKDNMPSCLFLFIFRQPHDPNKCTIPGDYHYHGFNAFVKKLTNRTDLSFVNLDYGTIKGDVVEPYGHAASSAYQKLMDRLHYVWKKETKEFITALDSNPKYFWWEGACEWPASQGGGKDKALNTAKKVIEAYFFWLAQQQYVKDKANPARLDFGDGPIPDSKANDTVKIKHMIDNGISWADIIVDVHKGKYEKYFNTILTKAPMFQAYQLEHDIQCQKTDPLRIDSNAPTDELYDEFAAGNYPCFKTALQRKFYRAIIYRAFFKKWYIPNFVDRTKKGKGTYILWLWSKCSDVGKTTLWREAMMEACGQKVQILATEKNGWHQDYQQNAATINVIDGFTTDDKDRGFGVKFFEAVGDGIPYTLVKRNMHQHPTTTPNEAWCITANSHYSNFFDNHICKTKLKNRINAIELTEVTTAFPLINMLYKMHGKEQEIIEPSSDCDLRAEDFNEEEKEEQEEVEEQEDENQNDDN